MRESPAKQSAEPTQWQLVFDMVNEPGRVISIWLHRMRVDPIRERAFDDRVLKHSAFFVSRMYGDHSLFDGADRRFQNDPCAFFQAARSFDDACLFPGRHKQSQCVGSFVECKHDGGWCMDTRTFFKNGHVCFSIRRTRLYGKSGRRNPCLRGWHACSSHKHARLPESSASAAKRNFFLSLRSLLS